MENATDLTKLYCKSRKKEILFESNVNTIKAPKNAPTGIYIFSQKNISKDVNFESFAKANNNDQEAKSPLNENTDPRAYINDYWTFRKENRVERYAYGWDGSIFDDKIHKLNLSKLLNPLENMNWHTVSKGVNKRILLVAGTRSSFIWHNEDHNLASILYLHFGTDEILGFYPPGIESQI